MGKNIYINEKRPHDSASKHVSGYADYTDDINEPNGTLHGAIGWSKKAHAQIKKIDLSEVWKSEGVISVIGYKDIPGKNDVGPVLMVTQYFHLIKLSIMDNLYLPLLLFLLNLQEKLF